MRFGSVAYRRLVKDRLAKPKRRRRSVDSEAGTERLALGDKISLKGKLMSAKIPAVNVKLKRAYESPAATDGIRILVDRLWPRGISKQNAALDKWMKEIAPSAQLRKWFGHDPARWDEFRRRYASEVHENAALLEQLRSDARCGRITLVYSARDEVHNDANVLRDLILGRKCS
jgi:uncharacterized protein YeaO (DUF488 family)